jgi:beta-ribofuranosylaminobenzene 5'-phosphate synthase
MRYANRNPQGRAPALAAAFCSMTRHVEAVCTARLHLGFLDLNGSLGRRFGSLGLALDWPRTRLAIRRSATTRATGPDQERAGRYLRSMVERLRLADGCLLDVIEAIPPHGGLGSGTQLALAVAAAVRRLHGLPLDCRGDAAALGRGRRSGIGIGLFESGGLVVDGGCGAERRPPRILSRLAVPPDWRVLLLIDKSRRGLSGAREAAAFGAVGAMPGAVSAELCRLVLMQALPAIAEDDLAAFGAAITRIQAIVGDHFIPAQGSRFASPRVAAGLAALAAMGATGIGQSSWGPTGFAFVRGEDAARRLVESLRAGGTAEGLDTRVCRALNQGATISETETRAD